VEELAFRIPIRIKKPEYPTRKAKKKRRNTMKVSKLKPFSIRKWAAGLIGLLLTFSLTFAFPSGAALADTIATPTPGDLTGTPPPPQPDKGAVTQANGSLTKSFQDAQARLTTLQGDLDKAAGAVSTLQAMIDRGESLGLDTSALSTALAAFQTGLSTAQTDLTTAASLLASHSGFDSNGAVTDPAAAAQTVQAVTQILQDAQDTLDQAMQALRAAAATWQADNTDDLQPGTMQKKFQNEQDWLTPQQANLQKAFELVKKIQALIASAQAEGLDTSALSTALNTFQAQLAKAQASHTNAAARLSALAGFDARGNVTDRASAGQTIQNAGGYLNAANNTLRQASRDLLAAVKAWEAANDDYAYNPGQGQNAPQDLEQVYQKAQTWLDTQTTNLEKANAAIDRIQALITDAQDQGQDTSALESALSTYESQLSDSEDSTSTASTLLSTHAGFDDDGNVTDQAAAAETVRDANLALTDASNLLSQAVRDLQNALHAWRTANGQ
jgi:hypothetical protein